jgi:hypothetical protein
MIHHPAEVRSKILARSFTLNPKFWNKLGRTLGWTEIGLTASVSAPKSVRLLHSRKHTAQSAESLTE